MTKCGKLITSTYENLAGRSNICEVERSSNGSLIIEFSGHTEICWESQLTVKSDDGQIKFLNQNGEIFLEEDVFIVPKVYAQEEESED